MSRQRTASLLDIITYKTINWEQFGQFVGGTASCLANRRGTSADSPVHFSRLTDFVKPISLKVETVTNTR